MIITQYVDIKIGNNLLKYYKEMGYNVDTKNYFRISINDLPKNSKHKIKVKCDICNKEKDISLCRYNINTKNSKLKYACSRKCAELKNKETVFNRYGVYNISLLDNIKEKKVETCLKNNNVKYPQQSKIIFEKSKLTKKQKYGDEFYQNNEKKRQTNINRYGVEHHSKNENIKEKTKKKQFEYFKNSILNKNYNFEIIDYDRINKYKIKCDCNKEHTFNISYKQMWHRLNNNNILCTECNPIDKHTSGLEIQMFNFIKENYGGEIIQNNRTQIGLELDIYLPELNLAFEFNGLYWHNELNKDNMYHKQKSELCDEKGIQLIHIWEDDWIYKKEIVKSMILNKLNKTEHRIYARKCVIKEITDNKIIRNFLDKNHIQGFVGSSVKIGLYHDDKLVSLMTFGKPRKNMNSISNNKDNYELLRFCNKLNTNVIGGASKLFNYFLNNFNYNKIITYADKSHSNGNLYKQLGFILICITEPNYYYIINGVREYRFNYRKDILVKQGFNENKTEHQIMLERKIYRIYNAGNYKFEIIKGDN